MAAVGRRGAIGSGAGADEWCDEAAAVVVAAATDEEESEDDDGRELRGGDGDGGVGADRMVGEDGTVLAIVDLAVDRATKTTKRAGVGGEMEEDIAAAAWAAVVAAAVAVDVAGRDGADD